ncbi:dTDP-4-amino-4,6-dideoxy-D-galactose acyltransferase [Tenebrionicola larvae]|uniref:dTDP-4-amino-4,6-dideoxy-D-galactose acyltransferase n=1 Tax=Tenebrionicola larvae TaxID=2815733 RepID=UPI002012C9B8|nr:dTDP-4-amino-4,6-dideoxy-D-galactose acyltransferase [Tenebrionicola larvae]
MKPQPLDALRASVEPLVWESEFFGLASAIVRFSDSASPLNVAQLQPFSRVQAKIAAEDTARLDALQALGFRLVEGEVDLSLATGANNPDPGLDVAQESDIAQLRAAASVFSQSRFREPWYPAGESARFYAQWVENAVRGSFDHECLILRAGAQCRGFITLRQLNEQEGRIGLLAGHGAGARLMLAARRWCEMRGLSRIRVATQISNRAALRRYIESGAVIERSAYWLYR